MNDFSSVQRRRIRDSARATPKGWSQYLKQLKLREFSESGEQLSVEPLFFTPVIYFLECNEQVVYVGQTTSLMTRITQHIQENTIVFTTFKYIVFKGSDKERLLQGKKFIKQIKPIYNVTHNKK